MQLAVTGRINPRVIDHILRERPDLTVKYWSEPGTISRRQFLDWATDADAMITMLTETVDREVLDRALRLKIVSNMAVGYDNFDLEELKRRKVLATNTPDVLTESTAELTVALMLMVMRRLRFAEDALRHNQWKGWEPDAFLGSECVGKTLGLVGFGRIAQAVMRRAVVFGMNVVVFTRRRLNTLPGGVRQVSWEELLTTSDIVSLHVPLNAESFHLIDDKALSQMRSTAVLINTARGAVVDENAVIRALKAGKLAGAGLDVFEKEPLSAASELRMLPQVTLLPHIGSATVETRTAMAERAWRNIAAFLDGKKPLDLLIPELWPEPQ
ncbi:MAG: D-glycerate dehydrogenase [Firmicutes bacterium]|jgi:glyoxylate reductase|uniref:D-glycerate dehydrogenase n=2 Tax=Sulfobacillus TaxID=28033 RepID=A0A2T2WPU2_SULTH|nr:D-glycerate dehydrogenase [Bacillota bacterium]MCL5014571.1 D-glycerate dehydrogenase [Bacillota bacterium]PSR24260.1 MAG: D-glycerate dehydrogenase [Sulfobacillus thermosulfidooxidans]PSR28843.1 MAG: D-glycerate dehydrogenase [Sulfobacillus benefaciens]